MTIRPAKNDNNRHSMLSLAMSMASRRRKVCKNVARALYPGSVSESKKSVSVFHDEIVSNSGAA